MKKKQYSNAHTVIYYQNQVHVYTGFSLGIMNRPFPFILLLNT